MSLINKYSQCENKRLWQHDLRCELLSHSTLGSIIGRYNNEWKKTEAKQRLESESHLSCEVIPSRKMFEAEETVPLAGSASAGVIVHNLTQIQNKEHYKDRKSSFVSRQYVVSCGPVILPNGLLKHNRAFKTQFHIFWLFICGVLHHCSLRYCLSRQNM